MKPLFKSLVLFIAVFALLSCEDKPVAPVLSTTSVSEITTSSAVSGGNITDDGGAAILSEGICWNTATDPTIDNSKTTETGGSLSFTGNITQLLPNTTYYVRAYATNSAGTGYGRSASFKTLGDKPMSINLNASNITINSVTFNSSVNANDLSTTVTFEYGVSSAYGSIITVPQNPVTGNSIVNVNADLTGLTPGTTYHFRIKTENALGITYSSDMTFLTLGKVPDVSVLAATNIQVKTAAIAGTVNANFLTSTVTFEWGTTTTYGNSSTPTQSPVNGSTGVNVSTILTGLTPGTTYHYRVKAINDLGTSNSDDLTFTTLGQIPSATTPTVTNLKVTQAVLNGIVNPNYLPTAVSFEWGKTTTYGNTLTLTQNPFEGNTSVNVSADLSGLDPETTYHFRIKATNELGTSSSGDMTFTTYALIDIDNNLYHSVTIGLQIWMKENLKTTKYTNGDLIGTTSTPTLDITTESSPKYQWAFDGNEANVITYGRLYTWYAVTDSRKVCPAGWHLPTDGEWTDLSDFLTNNGFGYQGSGDDIAKSLAATSGWGGTSSEGSTSFDQASNNSSGFTAMPGGYRFYDGRFLYSGSFGFWWSATEYVSTYAYIRELICNMTTLQRDGINSDKRSGYSVRCLHD
jgi:uncharacterized protein (TIGR02145 family)